MHLKKNWGLLITNKMTNKYMFVHLKIQKKKQYLYSLMSILSISLSVLSCSEVVVKFGFFHINTSCVCLTQYRVQLFVLYTRTPFHTTSSPIALYWHCPCANYRPNILRGKELFDRQYGQVCDTFVTYCTPSFLVREWAAIKLKSIKCVCTGTQEIWLYRHGLHVFITCTFDQ